MKWIYQYLLFTILCTGLAFSADAKKVPPPPDPPKLVNDYIGLLSKSEIAALEQKLTAYDDSTSTQIAIVIEKSLEGDDIFDYSHRLAESWGIGRKGKNNGILVYIAFEDRKLFIQTGYGAEGFLPDAIAKRIVDQVIVPSFRQQAYYQGLDRATDIIIKLGNGEYTNDEVRNGEIPLAVILFLIILFIVIIIIISKGSSGGGYYRRGRYDSGGGWIIFGPGGGSFGGGGGFGGFGGGSFGGGGAGGSW